MLLVSTVAQRRLLPRAALPVPLSSRWTPAGPGPVFAAPPERASLQRGALCSPGATMQVCNTKETECLLFYCLFSEPASNGNDFVFTLGFKTFQDSLIYLVCYAQAAFVEEKHPPKWLVCS